ncbi:5-oxoprolinase subunit C family protein [Segeticoccus rhizosphaerae]|jgi:biotin-dependent carboxylase-like uncharacterized protein|uniref:5-oxoprolinase subunit C family protein n=1 Tax=Segeticoccus rhizosphaerae TaxID=1104777 RepID=UPI0010BFB034|nr:MULTISPECIES: biotin-dependent carboxyltransferase family protein [Intrasporangiaceae]
MTDTLATLTVVEPGPFTTVQDSGRPGQGSLGIGRSGACDRASYQLANRLVGNPNGAAALEVTLGGLVVRAEGDLWVAVTGAPCPGVPLNSPVLLRRGEQWRFGVPSVGARSYLAVRGGIDVHPVLGSRSTDVLARLGPDPLSVGDRLPIGTSTDAMPGVDVAAVPAPTGDELRVQVLPGPRRDWFSDDAWLSLLDQRYTVTPDSNRVGLRLDGIPLERTNNGELISEGMMRGALQIPPSGTPVLFLADHPVTGGYPVIGYVADHDVDRCGQLQVGQGLRFTTRPSR